jgi:hypothetical protein
MGLLLGLILPALLLGPVINLAQLAWRLSVRWIAAQLAARREARYRHLNDFDRIVEEELDRVNRERWTGLWLNLAIACALLALASMTAGPAAPHRPPTSVASGR